jgi:hypothetical protein
VQQALQDKCRPSQNLAAVACTVLAQMLAVWVHAHGRARSTCKLDTPLLHCCVAQPGHCVPAVAESAYALTTAFGSPFLLLHLQAAGRQWLAYGR